ncbi:MAG TPA: hypothetical protein VK158_05080 [Acidobacteriota bacterium]|nr:hypothetical protein [Acidobacteriota bacterium]
MNKSPYRHIPTSLCSTILTAAAIGVYDYGLWNTATVAPSKLSEIMTWGKFSVGRYFYENAMGCALHELISRPTQYATIGLSVFAIMRLYEKARK